MDNAKQGEKNDIQGFNPTVFFRVLLLEAFATAARNQVISVSCTFLPGGAFCLYICSYILQ